MLNGEKLMARQIIKQPNGKFAIWSTIVDNFIMTDATPEEYIEFRIKEETERIKREIPEIINKLNNNIKVGYFDQTWESALERIRKVHGMKEVKKLIKGLEL